MQFRDKMVALVDRLRWKQKELAEEVGVSESTISRWLDGKGGPADLPTALRLARALGTTVDYLADDTLDQPPAPEELPEDRRFVMKTMDVLRVDGYEVVRRIYGRGEGPGGAARVIGERDETALARRQSGLQEEEEGERPDRPGVPPRRSGR